MEAHREGSLVTCKWRSPSKGKGKGKGLRKGRKSRDEQGCRWSYGDEEPKIGMVVENPRREDSTRKGMDERRTSDGDARQAGAETARRDETRRDEGAAAAAAARCQETPSSWSFGSWEIAHLRGADQVGVQLGLDAAGLERSCSPP